MLIPFSMLLAQDADFMEQTAGPEGIWSRVIAVHPNGSVFVSAQDGSLLSII